MVTVFSITQPEAPVLLSNTRVTDVFLIAFGVLLDQSGHTNVKPHPGNVLIGYGANQRSIIGYFGVYDGGRFNSREAINGDCVSEPWRRDADTIYADTACRISYWSLIELER